MVDIQRLKATIESNPIASITFIGLIAAFLFNIGFFFAIGLPYMSLFQVQDSIIFAITGALVTFAIAYFGLIVMNSGDFAANRDGWWNGRPIRWVFIGLALLSVVYFVGSRSYKYHNESGTILSMAFVLFFAFITFIYLVLESVIKLPDNLKSMVMLFGFVVLPVVSGNFYGLLKLYDRETRTQIRATLPDSTHVSVVRLGSDYSIVVSDDGLVHAVRTETLQKITSNPRPTTEPEGAKP